MSERAIHAKSVTEGNIKDLCTLITLSNFMMTFETLGNKGEVDGNEKPYIAPECQSIRNLTDYKSTSVQVPQSSMRLYGEVFLLLLSLLLLREQTSQVMSLRLNSANRFAGKSQIKLTIGRTLRKVNDSCWRRISR